MWSTLTRTSVNSRAHRSRPAGSPYQASYASALTQPDDGAGREKRDAALQQAIALLDESSAGNENQGVCVLQVNNPSDDHPRRMRG
jgi:hypothetical protein